MSSHREDGHKYELMSLHSSDPFGIPDLSGCGKTGISGMTSFSGSGAGSDIGFGEKSQRH